MLNSPRQGDVFQTNYKGVGWCSREVPTGRDPSYVERLTRWIQEMTSADRVMRADKQIWPPLSEDPTFPRIDDILEIFDGIEWVFFRDVCNGDSIEHAAYSMIRSPNYRIVRKDQPLPRFTTDPRQTNV
jgi:hypothetical protein